MGERRNIKLKGQRKAIKPSPKSYSASIVSGLALLYRKFSETSATWTARRFAGNKYEFHVIGAADDQAEPDGIRTFSFAQASAKAIEWDQQRQKATGAGGLYTVADAAKDWLDNWKKSEAGLVVATGNVNHYILPILGPIAVNALDSEIINDWLENMAKQPPLKVQQRMDSEAYKKLPPSKQSKIKYDPNDPETKRKRRDTANRVLNDLKAICNRAFGKKSKSITSNAAWATVKKLDNAAQAKQEFLTAKEVPMLLKACQPDFAKLVYGAIATGMRYAEQAGMKRGDYSKPKGFGQIKIIQPKTGKVKHINLNAGETQLFDEWIEGLEHDELVFKKANGSAWEKSNQQPRLRAALKKAGINRHIRYHDLRHSAASLLAAGGAPLAVISKQLGHSSQRVTERYAHLIDDYVAQSVRDSKPIFAMPINNKA